MGHLKIVKTTDADFKQQWRALLGKLSLEGELIENQQRAQQVRQMVERVRSEGDAAVLEFTRAYDGVDLQPVQMRVAESDLKKAHEQMEPDLLAALRQSIENVRRYQQNIMLKAPADWTENGIRLGARYQPLRRVGVCVPGASAPLVSTVIMTVVPAQVAGVTEIAVISAPRPEHNNSLHPAILGLCYELGVEDVYRVSGAQAVAALALGTEQIQRVDKIVGPGSWWGQLAKKEVFGLVDIDSFAGPSEVLILADETAKAEWTAADMLSQAEHAPGSAILVTDSQKLAEEVGEEVDRQLAELDRAEQTKEFVKSYSLGVVAANMVEAIAIANEFAAEHVQIQTQDSDALAEKIVNAGAIFIGPHTPVATGDYFAGPSHTLPTGGSARFFSALNVNDFFKQTSIISYDEAALKLAGDAITSIALAEGLDAHAKSVARRIRSTASK